MDKAKTVIRIQGLNKKFGSFSALNDFDLEVKEGQVHGFLGPNGSGKSTTIRIILGLLHKTSGDVTLFGEDPWQRAVDLHKRLAYVPGDVSLWPNLTGGEIIDLLCGLRGNIDEKRREHLLKRFELDPKKKFRTYSKGNRQKVAIVAALASDVELYVLDEPTSGLDPLMENVFQEEIRRLKREGKTVLLSSHILAEVEALCDTVTIINKGSTVETGRLKDIRRKHRLIMHVEAPKKLAQLDTLRGVANVEQDGDEWHFEVDTTQLDGVLSYLARQKVTTVTSHPPTLEDLFLRHYGVEVDEDKA